MLLETCSSLWFLFGFYDFKMDYMFVTHPTVEHWFQWIKEPIKKTLAHCRSSFSFVFLTGGRQNALHAGWSHWKAAPTSIELMNAPPSSARCNQSTALCSFWAGSRCASKSSRVTMYQIGFCWADLSCQFYLLLMVATEPPKDFLGIKKQDQYLPKLCP